MGGAYATEAALAAPSRVDEVWEAAVEMCHLVFERSWTGPRSTERFLTPPPACTRSAPPRW
ncbi:hypothetical protein GCM10020216_037760 [Nonomuraea helvata]